MNKVSLSFFDDVVLDVDLFRRRMQSIEGSSKNYCIYFTPRSGSSWLTSLLSSTGMLGTPEEWLNPNFVPLTAKAINAKNFTDYFKMLRRMKRTRNGVFGVEATYFQLRATIGDTNLSEFISDKYTPFLLLRKNIVLQGISLYRATDSNYFHSVIKNSDALEKSKITQYNPIKIKDWCSHILKQEMGLTDLIYTRELKHHSLFYEDLFRDPNHVVEYFSGKIGVEGPFGSVESTHQKIGDSKNDDWDQKFRAEESEFLSELALLREELFEKLAKFRASSLY